GRVPMSAAPASALTSVDLPAPEPPSRPSVRPGATSGRSASSPVPRCALTASTRAAGAASATASATACGTAAMSHFVSTTTGVAPDSQARASSRSIRPRSGSGWTGSTTAAVSRFAASTWPCDCRPAVCRTTAVRRGSTLSMVLRWPGQVRSATQSPAQGRATGSRATAASSRPDRLARSGPAAVSTVHTPRSTRVTRPGRWSGRACAAKAEAKASSQPRDARSNVIGSLVVERAATRAAAGRSGADRVGPTSSDDASPGNGRAMTDEGKPLIGTVSRVTADPLVLMSEVDRASDRLLETVGRLRDDDVTCPSLLPGWSRGHVLAHLARNADSLTRLLDGARAGVRARQYPSREHREAEITAGAGRGAAEQLADLRAAAERFASAVDAMPADAWAFVLDGDPPRPAASVVWRRLR